MRVVHALAGAEDELVDGASNSVWTLARAQAEQGHHVTVLLRGRPGRRSGVTGAVAVAAWSDPAVRSICRRADVLHAHSAFCPRLAGLRRAVWGVVPVVVSPRGALAGPVLRRHRCRKTAYGVLVERPLVRSADLVVALTEAEAADVRRFAGSRCPPVTVIGNPIRPLPPATAASREGVVFLGRFDPVHKGLDRLCAVARRSRAAYRLYGHGRAGDTAAERFLAGLPANVTVHPPVFGERKAAVLGSAALYTQPSRWEAFGRSLAEAAMAGTALVVSAECDLAGQVTAAGGGLVVDFDRPDRTAAAIDALLAGGSDARRAAMGRAAATWAARNFAPSLVATRTIAAYRTLG